MAGKRSVIIDTKFKGKQILTFTIEKTKTALIKKFVNQLFEQAQDYEEYT